MGSASTRPAAFTAPALAVLHAGAQPRAFDGLGPSTGLVPYASGPSSSRRSARSHAGDARVERGFFGQPLEFRPAAASAGAPDENAHWAAASALTSDALPPAAGKKRGRGRRSQFEEADEGELDAEDTIEAMLSRPEAGVSFLAAEGAKDSEVLELNERFPLLKYMSVEDAMRPLSEYLRTVGIEPKGIVGAFRRDPGDAVRMLQNVDYLNTAGIGGKQMARLLLAYPKILTTPMEEIRYVVEFLERLGIDEKRFEYVVKGDPFVFQRPLKLPTTVAFLRAQGFSKKVVREIALRFPRVFKMSTDTVRQKVEFLERIGIRGRDLHRYLAACPTVLGWSLDTLSRKALYLTEGMGRSAHELLTCKNFFTFSLEDRMVPRHEFATECGRDLSLSSLLQYSDDKFAALCGAPPEDYGTFKGELLARLGSLRRGKGVAEASPDDWAAVRAKYHAARIDYGSQLAPRRRRGRPPAAALAAAQSGAAGGGAGAASPAPEAPSPVEEALPPTPAAPRILAFLERALRLSKRDAAMCLVRVPSLAKYSVKRKLEPTVAYLTALGIPAPAVGKMVFMRPSLLTLSVDGHIAPVVDFLTDKVGVPKHEVPILLSRSLNVLGFSLARLEATRVYFRSLGISGPDFASMSVMFPGLFHYRTESLDAKVAYMRSEMRRDPGELVEFPAFLGCSLEGRIKPRWTFLRGRDAGRAESASLAVLCALSDDNFCRVVAKCRLDEFQAFKEAFTAAAVGLGEIPEAYTLGEWGPYEDAGGSPTPSPSPAPVRRRRPRQRREPPPKAAPLDSGGPPSWTDFIG